MNFSGYVPMRRGIIEHTMHGRLTNTEALVFMTLVMLADKETGSGLINARVLRVFLPELKKDAAKRVLQSLETKRYIFRQITPRSPLIYPYWVDKFIPSTGPYKLLQLDLTEAFQTQNVGSIRYGKVAPDGAPVSAPVDAPVTAPVGAHYNNKRKEISKKREEKTSLPSKEECASTCADRVSAEQASGQRDAHLDDSKCARGHNVVRTWPQNDVAVVTHPHQGVGLRWDGQLGFVDIKSHTPVSLPTVVQRVTAINLEYRNGQFFDAKSQPIPTDNAQFLLSGADERNAA